MNLYSTLILSVQVINGALYYTLIKRGEAISILLPQIRQSAPQSWLSSMVGLLPRPANRLRQVRLSDLLPARKVSRSDLRIDLDARVGWEQVFCSTSDQYHTHAESVCDSARLTRDIVPLQDGDAGLDDSVVFPAAKVSSLYSVLPGSAVSHISLIDTMLSIFLIPSQCSTSGMSAWKRMSFTPAMSSVA